MKPVLSNNSKMAVLGAVAALALLVPSRALGYDLRHDSTGAEVAWTAPVQFVVDQNAAELLDEPKAFDAVQRAVATYADAIKSVPVSVKAGTTHGVGYDARPGAQNQSEIVVVTDGWTYDSNAIAVTVVTVDSKNHVILDADIALNAQMRKFAVLPDIANLDTAHDDIQNTLTHELGHALGLAHNPEDAQAVMFPSAHRGETSKRALSDDDKAGLTALYGSLSTSHSGLGALGCSQSGQWPSFLPLVAVIALLSLRRKLSVRKAGAGAVPTIVAAAVLLGGSALASERDRAPADAQRSDVVATAEVTRAVTRTDGGVWRTELTLTLRSCLKGACPESTVVVVPGGKQGDLEQWIDGVPAPVEGTRVGVTVRQAQTQKQAQAPSESRIYRLDVMRDFEAFARGLDAAGLSLDERVGSQPTLK